MTATARRRAFRRKLFVAFLAALALASVRQLTIAPGHGQDFRDFFAAATLVAEGRNPYDTGALAREQDALYNQPDHLKPGDLAYYDPIPYPQGPWEAIALVPLTGLPWQLAYLAYLATAAAAIALAAWWLLRGLSWNGGAVGIAVGAAVVSPVAFINLFQGQPVPILLASFAGAWALLRNGRAAVAGALLGVAWIKPHIGLPLVLVLAMLEPGRWRQVLAGFAAGTLVLFGIAAIVLRAALLDWPKVVLGQWSGALQQADLASINAFYYPILGGALRQAVVMLVLLAAAAYAVWALRRARPGLARAMTVLLLSLVAAPYAHSYDALLLLPVALVLLGPRQEGWRHPSVEIALWAFAIFPLFYFAGFHLGYFNGFSAIPVVLLAIAWHRHAHDRPTVKPLAEAA